MKVDTDKCIKHMQDNYGITHVAAKNILDDFKLWCEVEEKRDKEGENEDGE